MCLKFQTKKKHIFFLKTDQTIWHRIRLSIKLDFFRLELNLLSLTWAPLVSTLTYFITIKFHSRLLPLRPMHGHQIHGGLVPPVLMMIVCGDSIGCCCPCWCCWRGWKGTIKGEVLPSDFPERNRWKIIKKHVWWTRKNDGFYVEVLMDISSADSSYLLPYKHIRLCASSRDHIACDTTTQLMVWSQ